MNLDKRIANITDIYSVNDGCHDYRFMNTNGYFANRISDFQDLSKCAHGEYTGYRELDKCFSCRSFASNAVTPEYDWFTYFIPEEDLKFKEPEKVYRTFTLEEFKVTFKIGKVIRFRQKGDTNPFQLMLLGYIPFLNHQGSWIVLGDSRFSLEGLFKNYELYDPATDKYIPFGILD